MYPVIVGIIVVACAFGGALLGMRLRAALPAHHLDADSRDTVKVGVGLVATMTALVLGLITASAKNSFDAVDTTVKQTAIEILALDSVLARYGPETGEIRKSLQNSIGARIEMTWPESSFAPANLNPIRSETTWKAEGLSDAIRGLKPRDDSQRALQSRALDLVEALLKTKWLVITATESTVPVLFLVILLFWLAITFTSFGLFAPRNATVLVVLFVCALSVGSALFLVLEMDAPFDGLLKVSADPLRHAIAHINR